MSFLPKFRKKPVAALYQVNDPDKDPFYTQIDYLKYPKEAPLHTLATQLKYDKSRGVNYNVEVLASAIQHPYGEVLLRSPSYCDFRFFYETKSQSSYSDALTTIYQSTLNSMKVTSTKTSHPLMTVLTHLMSMKIGN